MVLNVYLSLVEYVSLECLLNTSVLLNIRDMILELQLKHFFTYWLADMLPKNCQSSAIVTPSDVDDLHKAVFALGGVHNLC